MKHLLITTALFGLAPTWAVAATVYPGCAAPTVKAGRHTFYVDPATGSSKGDGSLAKPWHTLAEVLYNGTKLVATTSNPTGPIKAGDVIMLKSGNHGEVKFTGLFNTDFITVMPAPGQTPVIQAMTITSGGKWMFQGLKFMPGVSKSRPGGIVAIGYGDWQGPTQNIIVDASTVSTVDDTSSWSAADWKANTQGTGIWTQQGISCISITNNHIYNTLNGVAMSASNSVVQGNTIEKMFNDGIDVTSSNILIKNNTIRGGTNSSNSEYHADGIQGWSAVVNKVEQTNQNVTIDGNIITKFGDPTQSYMQGISIFDGNWNNLVIENNVIAVNHMNAVVLMGTQNSKVIDNTVIATGPKSFSSWIQLRNGKNGAVSNNALVRNNISSVLSIAGTKMQVDHNIAALSIGIPGKSAITTGSVGDGNKVVPGITDQFVSFNASAQQADMRLKAGSAAIGAGLLSGAAPIDIAGRVRTAPTDLGAYAYK